MRIWKSILIIFLTQLCFLKSVSHSYALPSFSTDYSIIYDVNQQGQTHVTFNIAQKNNLSSVYATSFSLSLSQTNLTNIKVSDGSGPLNPSINTTDNLTNINFDFVNKVVGKDKINQFSIQYDSSDIASQQGSVWEVNIPKLETNENTNSQLITLKVPTEFGQPAYIDPKPTKIEQSSFLFNSATLANKSISAVFGSIQFFRLNLTYHLTNSLDSTLKTQIALPPQTTYQDIYVEALQPPAKDIQVDSDGNWLAAYQLPANTNLDIKASVIVKLNFDPRKVNLDQPNPYTRSTKFWNYEDPEINTKTKNLNTAKSIYDFVVNTLQYDYSRLTTSAVNATRQGAVFALDNPLRAICTEFTDLFVALARASGIPSRELQGYAFSNNDKLKPLSLDKDILHSWPEYYSQQKQTWVQVDPTWGNTTGGIDYFNKLDLNHIVFAIHGTDPNQPLPAGAYKNQAALATKDVQVQIIPPFNLPSPKFKISYDHQDHDRLYITLSNTTGVAGIADIKIAGPSAYGLIQSKSYLPPYGSSTIEFSRNSRPLLKPQAQTLIIDVNDQRLSENIISQPYFPTGLILGGIVCFAVAIAFITRSIYLRRRRKKPPLHW